MNSKNDKETPQITSPVSTVAENAVDQLHANEKLIAGKRNIFFSTALWKYANKRQREKETQR